MAVSIPMFLFVRLFIIRHKLFESNQRVYYGYLYNEYKPEAYFWEILKIQVKVIVIIILTFY